jgi:hypothetical protein
VRRCDFHLIQCSKCGVWQLLHGVATSLTNGESPLSAFHSPRELCAFSWAERVHPLSIAPSTPLRTLLRCVPRARGPSMACSRP